MKIKDVLQGIQLSKNFNALEFANTEDGNAILVPDITLFTKLQLLRNEVGPVEITSGYRTKEYNEKVGGIPNSYHTHGLAADVRFNHSKYSKRQLTELFRAIGFTNVGFYYVKKKLDRFHLDIGKPHRGNFYTFDKNQ